MSEKLRTQANYLWNSRDQGKKIINTELFSSLSNQNNWEVDDVKDTDMLHIKDWDRCVEILSWTLYAEDKRGKLIKFLLAHWFKPVDNNKHEKYRNDKNVTVGVPHQHWYFALFDTILKEAGYTKKDYINRNSRGKKGNRRN